MSGLRIVLAFFLAVPVTPVCAQTNSRPFRGEQTSFSAEDEGVRSPVRIPDDAWAVLKKKTSTEIYLNGDDEKPAEPQRSWFSAAVVHLQDSKRNDLVIVGEEPLAGGNIVTFWVFLDTPSGMKLAATAGAHDLVVQRSRYKGVRTIKLYSMNCCEITTTWLRLERGEFRQYRQVTKDIK